MALGTLLVAFTLLSAACSTEDGSAADDTTDAGNAAPTEDGEEIVGLFRDPPLQVGEQSLPDVTDPAETSDFELKAPEGELLLVYFGYTFCPDVCPTTLADIRASLAEMGTDAERVTVAMATVDPERDTDDVLRDYIEFFAPDNGRALRTSDFEELHEVEAAFLTESRLVPSHTSPDYEVVHNGSVYLIDDTGTVLVEWPFGISRDSMQDSLRESFTQI